VESDQRDLLLSLAYLYICCGRPWRALPMLLLVLAQRTGDHECLRMLAHVYTVIRRSELALVVLDCLDKLETTPDAGNALLRARALHQLGRLDEARTCFAHYTRHAEA